MSDFRPSDAQCATLWSDDDLDLEGRWENDDRLVADLCFRDPDDDGGDDDDETVQTSFQILNSEGVATDAFASGFWHANGKIFTGTWYQDFVGGPLMMWVRDNGDVDYTQWTGLFQQEGRTVLDGSQAHNSALHTTGTWNGPRKSTTSNQCTRYEVLQTFVLKNLRAIADDDEDYYYFIDELYLSDSEIEYRNVQDSSSSAVIVSAILVTLGILATLF